MKTFLRYSLIFLLFAIPTFVGLVIPAFGQAMCPVKTFKLANVRGEVLSAGRENPPVPGTKIELRRLGGNEVLVSSTFTDKEGVFEFHNISKGKYRLVVYFFVEGNEVAPKYDSVILNLKKSTNSKSDKLILIKLGASCFDTDAELVS